MGCVTTKDDPPDEYAGHWNLTRGRWEPEIDGERHTLLEWSKIYGVGIQLMIDRVKRGWNWEVAIIKRPRKYRENAGDRERRIKGLAVGPGLREVPSE